MNIALLSRCIFKIESEDSSPCIQLLRNKYLGGRSFFQVSNLNTSQFWQCLQKTGSWYQFGRGVILGDGRHTKLWLDVWAGDSSL